jgi:hypothetical protein
MAWGKRKKDNQSYQKVPKVTTQLPLSQGQTFNSIRKQETKRQFRQSKQNNLENEMIFKNFVKRLEKLNPNEKIDLELIDRKLEWEEALIDLHKKHPQIVVEEVKEAHMKEWKEDLENRGIGNEKVKNLVAQSEPPLSEREIEEVAGALNTRSDHAVKVDKGLQAKVTKDVRKWAKKPNELDISTVDEKEVKVRDR